MDGLVLGRIVRYVAYNHQDLVAIIIGVNNIVTGDVDIALFTNMGNVNGTKSYGLQFHTGILFSDELIPDFNDDSNYVIHKHKPGTWHWPQHTEGLLSVK